MPRVESKTTTPVFQWAKRVHVLDRAVAEIDYRVILRTEINIFEYGNEIL
jgi:hypothetical protein